MALRERLFDRGATLFDGGRLALAFVSNGFQFAPIAVAEWQLTATSAEGTVVWSSPMSTSISGVNLLEDGAFVEFFPFVDENGNPDHARLLPNMELEYSLTVSLDEAA